MVSQVAKKKEERSSLTRPFLFILRETEDVFPLPPSHFTLFPNFRFSPPHILGNGERKAEKEGMFFAQRSSWKSGHFSTNKRNTN